MEPEIRKAQGTGHGARIENGECKNDMRYAICDMRFAICDFRFKTSLTTELHGVLLNITEINSPLEGGQGDVSYPESDFLLSYSL